MNTLFEEKLKSRDLLKTKIQHHYVHIKDCLKDSDIEAIIDRLFERNVFSSDLVDEIRSCGVKRHEKASKLIENIMKCDEESMLYFLELVQFIMPIVYESITGNKGYILYNLLKE
jgi:hypothetical protein